MDATFALEGLSDKELIDMKEQYLVQGDSGSLNFHGAEILVALVKEQRRRKKAS